MSSPPSSIPPMTPAESDLRGLPFMPLDVVRLADSDLAALSSGEEFKAALLLIVKSWTQRPAGSLPDDDRVLAHLSGAGARWPRLRGMALRGWHLCTDGRLYHPVVAEKACQAWAMRQTQRARALRRWKKEEDPVEDSLPPEGFPPEGFSPEGVSPEASPARGAARTANARTAGVRTANTRTANTRTANTRTAGVQASGAENLHAEKLRAGTSDAHSASVAAADGRASRTETAAPDVIMCREHSGDGHAVSARTFPAEPALIPADMPTHMPAHIPTHMQQTGTGTGIKETHTLSPSGSPIAFSAETLPSGASASASASASGASCPGVLSAKVSSRDASSVGGGAGGGSPAGVFPAGVASAGAFPACAMPGPSAAGHVRYAVPQASRLPSDWQPDAEARRFARDLGLDADQVLARFRDYWLARAGSAGLRRGWAATWRIWCRGDAERAASRHPAASGRRQRDRRADLLAEHAAWGDGQQGEKQ